MKILTFNYDLRAVKKDKKDQIHVWNGYKKMQFILCNQVFFHFIQHSDWFESLYKWLAVTTSSKLFCTIF